MVTRTMVRCRPFPAAAHLVQDPHDRVVVGSEVGERRDLELEVLADVLHPVGRAVELVTAHRLEDLDELLVHRAVVVADVHVVVLVGRGVHREVRRTGHDHVARGTGVGEEEELRVEVLTPRPAAVAALVGEVLLPPVGAQAPVKHPLGGGHLVVVEQDLNPHAPVAGPDDLLRQDLAVPREQGDLDHRAAAGVRNRIGHLALNAVLLRPRAGHVEVPTRRWLVLAGFGGCGGQNARHEKSRDKGKQQPPDLVHDECPLFNLDASFRATR
jgi:hypothetical protein